MTSVIKCVHDELHVWLIFYYANDELYTQIKKLYNILKSVYDEFLLPVKLLVAF
jgi:hypothetical protein